MATLRVFLSSTFVDMRTERDQIVRRALPKIRLAANKRGLTLTEVSDRFEEKETETETKK